MNFLKMLDIREFLDFSLKNSHPFLFLVVSKIYLKTEISLKVETLYRRPKITKSQSEFSDSNSFYHYDRLREYEPLKGGRYSEFQNGGTFDARSQYFVPCTGLLAFQY